MTAALEWTAAINTGGQLRPVGTTGDLAHARGELADWAKDRPDLPLVLASREQPAWQVDQAATDAALANDGS